MGWLTEKETVDKVRKQNYYILKSDIKKKPHLLFNGIVEDDVKIDSVRQYCTSDAWVAIVALIKAKKRNGCAQRAVKI